LIDNFFGQNAPHFCTLGVAGIRPKLLTKQNGGVKQALVLLGGVKFLSALHQMRFVIISQPRTGSTHLVTRLNGHPDILCNGELFNAQAIYLRWPENAVSPLVLSELQKKRRSDPHAFLEEMFATTFGRSHVGFKIFATHDPLILEHVAKTLDVRKVILYRTNVLANYSSTKIARASKTWKLKQGDRPAVTGEQLVEFDPAEFVRFHNRYVNFYARIIERLNATSQSFFLIRYDELNDDHIFASLVNFIGARGNEIQTRLSESKQNVPDILCRFSNPRAVAEFLEPRNLMHWRNEGEVSLLPIQDNARAAVE
jgi:hypothetical protein